MVSLKREYRKLFFAVLAWVTLFPLPAFAGDDTLTSVMLIAYAALGLAGFVGIAGWAWWSYDLRKNGESQAQPQQGALKAAPEEFVEHTPMPRANTGEFRVEPSPAPQLQVVLRSVQGEADRECPRCSRTFPQGIVVCPIDATPLEPIRRRRTPSASGDGQPFCDTCGRVYDHGTTFCYHDGQELGRDPAPASVSFFVCKSCGWETDIPGEVCPHDGEELTAINPHDQRALQPTIPMMTCRSCGHIAGPGESTCPHDGQMLYPLLNVRLSALPTQGVGPRRKVCTTCGRTYSRAGNYCAHDGDKLTPLN